MQSGHNLFLILGIAYLGALVVAGLKGNWGWFLGGLFIGPLALVGALQPAQQGSWWDRRNKVELTYGTGPAAVQSPYGGQGAFVPVPQARATAPAQHAAHPYAAPAQQAAHPYAAPAQQAASPYRGAPAQQAAAAPHGGGHAAPPRAAQAHMAAGGSQGPPMTSQAPPASAHQPVAVQPPAAAHAVAPAHHQAVAQQPVAPQPVATPAPVAVHPDGWYPDPHDASRQRYWAAGAWTEHLHPPVQAVAPQPVA